MRSKSRAAGKHERATQASRQEIILVHTHLLLMLVFALLISVALAALLRATTSERLLYAARSFALFVFVGLAIAWLLYPFSQ